MASPPAIPSAADADLEILDAIATSSVARRSSRALLWGPQDEVIEGIEQDAEESATCESPLTPENYRSYMWNRGWCSHQIEHLLRAYGKDWPCLLKFAELDRRLHRQQDHRPCLSTSHCIAYDSPPDQDYHVQHVTHCPGCDMVQTPQKALAAVVASGGVPLISIQGLDEPNCAVSLRVHRREFRTKYMAVSHVWADGLGNPFNNALPVCQIKRLHGLVMYMKNNKWATGRKTSMQICDDWLFGTWKSELLWIDTLCVPVGRDQEDLRSQCIDAMSSIYAESSTVVVLDAELMQSPMPLERDDLTPLYRIASSVWACRSWTLQEGTLPPDIFFRFKDGCFNPGKRLCHYATWTRLGKVIKPLDAAEVHSRLWSEQWAIVPTLYEGCFSRDILIWYRANDFASTWNGLSGRSTTRPSDLYIVLASCLGFRLRQFQHITTTEAKMQRIIFSYPELPLSLFYNHGPKMHSNEDHHNRWVPSQISNHLLTCGGSFDFPKPWISVYSDQGTLLKLNLVNETVLLVAEPLSMPLASAVSDGTTTYRIDVQVSELDQFQASKYAGTCFVLSEDTNFSDGSQEGACFYISDQVQDPETGEQLSIVMVYFAPLKATRLEPSPESALSPATIHADRVSIRDLWVKFGMYQSQSK